MTNIEIRVDGAAIGSVRKEGLLTTGMVGATVTFSFDASWAGLTKTAVFWGSGATKDVARAGTVVRIPPEALQREGQLLVGVVGIDTDGDIAIPTVWAGPYTVKRGANASGDPSTDPSLPVWAQIQAEVGEPAELKTADKSSLVAAINEVLSKGGGDIDEDTLAQLVEEYLAEHPTTVTETDPNVPDWAKQPQKPSYTAEEVGAIAAPAAAAVGQTIVVSAVDEDGKPMAWECVDVGSSGSDTWKLLVDFEATEELAANTGMLFDTSDDGEPFDEKELIIDWYCPPAALSSYVTFKVNDQKLNGGCLGSPNYFWAGELLNANATCIVTLRMVAMTDCCMLSASGTRSLGSVFYSYEEKFKTIDSVQLTAFGGTYPVGFKFKIWGRK